MTIVLEQTEKRLSHRPFRPGHGCDAAGDYFSKHVRIAIVFAIRNA
jgi:hypothetical protein